jgi:arylsulfatase A-like enzyme
MIFFLGDHGELLFEHGRMAQSPDFLQHLLKRVFPNQVSKYRLFDRYGYVGHQGVIPYDELTNVPLIVKLPEQKFAGTEQSTLVQTIDVFATIVDQIADLNLDSQGSSLYPAITDGAEVNEYVHTDSPTLFGNRRYQSVRTKNRKYIQTKLTSISAKDIYKRPDRTLFSILSQVGSHSDILFDVKKENEDISSNNESDLGELRAELQSQQQRNEEWSANYRTETSEVDADAKERLENLGYV